MNNYRSGKWAEFLARLYLRLHGYQIVAKNIIVGRGTTAGEIDIIACKHKCLVFVEVKLRKSAGFAAAREFVDSKKQNRLRLTAGLYLSQNPTELQPRFDVIEIYAPEGEKTSHPVIHHLEDAFE